MKEKKEFLRKFSAVTFLKFQHDGDRKGLIVMGDPDIAIVFLNGGPDIGKANPAQGLVFFGTFITISIQNVFAIEGVGDLDE